MSTQTLVRIIDVAGFKVEVHNFGKRSFYYPAFNGNAEFPVSGNGFRQLSSYLRTVQWMDVRMEALRKQLFG